MQGNAYRHFGISGNALLYEGLLSKNAANVIYSL